MKLIVTLTAEVADETQANNYLAALRQWLKDKPGITGTAESRDDKSGMLKQT